MTRQLANLRVVMISALSIAAALASSANMTQPAHAAAKPASSAAQSSFESGVKSYKSGRLQPAIDQLSSALRAGGLSSNDLAKAMYLRGLAYKKQNKPGLAISDLTSAVWLTNGLNDADKADALAQRAEAYKLAGLADGEQAASVVVADPKAASRPLSSATAPSQSAAVPTTPVAVTDAATQGATVPEQAAAITRASPNSTLAEDAARARRLAAAPVIAPGLASAGSATLLGDPPAPEPQSVAVAPPVVEAQPAAAMSDAANQVAVSAPAPSTYVAAPSVAQAPAPTVSSSYTQSADSNALSALPGSSGSDSGTAGAGTADLSAVPGAVAGFFSNLFTGGSSAPSAEPATTIAAATPVATSASEVPAFTTSSISPSPTASTTPQVLPPSRLTQAPTPAPRPVKASSGRYKLHIAAMRSRQEAEALAAKLATSQAGLLDQRVPTVDAAAIGSMGTFYRVRVGNYASASEPKSICDKLRGGGFDCLVVTN